MTPEPAPQPLAPSIPVADTFEEWRATHEIMVLPGRERVEVGLVRRGGVVFAVDAQGTAHARVNGSGEWSFLTARSACAIPI